MDSKHWLQEAKPYETGGEFFKAYDILTQGLEEFPEDPWLAHRAVLNLANAGATALARRKYEELGLRKRSETDIAALNGRLLKDQAFGLDGAERRQRLGEAAEAYEKAYADAKRAGDPNAYYPAINIATLRLLQGEKDLAAKVAREVLDLLLPRIGDKDFGTSGDRYWVLATAAEASIVSGDMAQAETFAKAAREANAGQHLALASTARQFRLVLASQGQDPAWLKEFSPPEVVHYTGHMPALPGGTGRFQPAEEPQIAEKIRDALSGRSIGAAYGSLAAGADILFAEAVLAKGASLNLVFPFAQEDFLEQSVRPFGEQWVARFEACLAKATTVRYATEDEYLGDDQLYVYCSQLAMGLAAICARHMGAPVRQVAVWDGRRPSGIAGTGVDLALGRKLGMEQIVIRCGSGPEADIWSALQQPAVKGRAPRAMLFGDIKGFSKLTDRQIPLFRDKILEALGEAIETFGADVQFRNTWGDGIFVVFEDIGVAARAALALQKAVEGVGAATEGLPGTMALRLGGHFGPIYEIDDPILHRRNYLGAHVSRAARIEPITPEGCVYVTETFAAVLALTHPKEFACDYVGVTEMAKHYGQLRMFLLRPAVGHGGPLVLREVR